MVSWTINGDQLENPNAIRKRQVIDPNFMVRFCTKNTKLQNSMFSLLFKLYLPICWTFFISLLKGTLGTDNTRLGTKSLALLMPDHVG